MFTLFVLALLIGTVWWVARKVRRDGVFGLMITVWSALGTLLAGVLRLVGEAADDGDAIAKRNGNIPDGYYDPFDLPEPGKRKWRL